MIEAQPVEHIGNISEDVVNIMLEKLPSALWKVLRCHLFVEPSTYSLDYAIYKSKEIAQAVNLIEAQLTALPGLQNLAVVERVAVWSTNEALSCANGFNQLELDRIGRQARIHLAGACSIADQALQANGVYIVDNWSGVKVEASMAKQLVFMYLPQSFTLQQRWKTFRKTS